MRASEMKSRFAKYASDNGVTPGSPWIDIVDSAIEFLESRYPCPGDVDGWFARNNPLADKSASEYADHPEVTP